MCMSLLLIRLRSAGNSIISDLHGMMSVMQSLRSGIGEPEALELRLFALIPELAELHNLMQSILGNP